MTGALNSYGSGRVPVAGFYEDGSESLGSVNTR